MKRLAGFVLLAGVLAGCGVQPVVSAGRPEPAAVEAQEGPWVPALMYPQPAGGGETGPYFCYDQWGNAVTQDEAFCAEGWGNRPPENPVTLGGPVGIGAPVP